MNIQLPLAQRDLYLIQIEAEIKNKKNLLVKKQKDLNKKQKLNHYLDNVKNDYDKYYNFIYQEKKQQYDSLILLKEYMDDLIKTEQIVDEQLRTAKHDQKYIIEEIDKVKVELDDLIA
jgi:ATP-dependent protease HslVU (ClpYQ) ATPase subunit